jgi:hypothetical protein
MEHESLDSEQETVSMGHWAETEQPDQNSLSNQCQDWL